MREYTIIRRPDVLDWEKIPALQMDLLYHTDPLPISAQAQVCYDDEALYVRLSAVEENIRAEYFGKLDEICEDSCLEFFFSPMAGDRRYFNIECNPNGCLYLGMGSNVQTLVRFVPEFPSILPQTKRTADGWETVYSVPYSFIRRFFPDFDPAPGKAMRANCSKCGSKTVRPHWLTWNRLPFANNKLDFHSPEHYGRLIFG